MIRSLTPAPSKQESASLLIGSDLRAAGSNAAWRRLGLPGGISQARERVDKLFPSSEAAACVLDVLASGTATEHVVLRIGGNGTQRFLSASFHPYPSAGKPEKVLMQAWELSSQFLLDGDTGAVVAMNPTAKAAFGNLPASLPVGQAALTAAARDGSHYLGRFQHRRADGTEVEMESLLIAVEDDFQVSGSVAK